ncbi:MAG: putative metal-binding motif-containing protein [archaeon]
MKNMIGIILAAFIVFIFIGFSGTGFAQEACPVISCTDADGDGYTLDATCNIDTACTSCKCDDCDDITFEINPGVEEVCGTGLDMNCNELIDCQDLDCCSNSFCPEGAPNWYFDNDQDGYTICEGDCDDITFEINPGVEEVCGSGLDMNCNGLYDCYDSDCCTDNTRCLNEDPDWWFDADHDGYKTCQNDCNDNNAAINPSATETCDDIVDNDCDGTTDCSDTDCATDPACSTQTCTPKGDKCEESEDCCNELKCKIQEDSKRIKDQEPQKICCQKDECSSINGCIAENTCTTTNHKKVCAHGTWIPTTKAEQNCNDNIDNDCDAKIDCTDEDCKNRPVCGTCATDDDCKENEACKNDKCIRVQCKKGEHFDNHKCKKLECYKKNDCESDELCCNHKCIDRPKDQKESKKYIKENAERLMDEAAENIVNKKFQKIEPHKIISQVIKLRDAKVAYFNDEYEKSEAFATEIITGNEEPKETAVGMKGFLNKIKSFFVR